MDFKEYADGFIDYIEDLTEDEFEELLLDVGIEEYFSAFSKKKNTINFNVVQRKKSENFSCEKVKIRNLKGTSNYKFNYKVNSGSQESKNSFIVPDKGAA